MAQVKLSLIQQKELSNSIINDILKGKPMSKILKVYSTEYKILQDVVARYYEAAKKKIVESIAKDYTTLFDSHVYFYEHIYGYFEEINNTTGMLKALHYKEKLLGLHNETTNVEVNNTEEVVVDFQSRYDFTKLSEKNKDRLQYLMKKVAKEKK